MAQNAPRAELPISPGNKYGYEIKIEAEFEDITATWAGLSVYDVLSADDRRWS